jgi:hypothetical protein
LKWLTIHTLYDDISYIKKIMRFSYIKALLEILAKKIMNKTWFHIKAQLYPVVLCLLFLSNPSVVRASIDQVLNVKTWIQWCNATKRI